MMKNVKIISENSTITIGDNNVIQVYDGKDINWETLEKQLFALIRKLPETSNEFAVAQKAIKYTVKKDEKGLRNLIRSHIGIFTSDLFSSTASGILADFIKKFILI
jgi:hypothetical protein